MEWNGESARGRNFISEATPNEIDEISLAGNCAPIVLR